jgi:hypothetical protein
VTSWSLPVFLVAGVVLGPRALNLLTPSLVQLFDPIVAMSLAMTGVAVGLRFERRSHIEATAGIIVTGGLVIAALRGTDVVSFGLMMLSVVAIAAILAFAGSLLVAESDSERERQVFVAGTLLLLGGAAAYLSLSALLAGLLAGTVWKARGDPAHTRIVQEIDSFRHPFVVLLLLAAGASIPPSSEMVALGAVIVAVDVISPPNAQRFQPSVGLVIIGLTLDALRGPFR